MYYICQTNCAVYWMAVRNSNNIHIIMNIKRTDMLDMGTTYIGNYSYNEIKNNTSLILVSMEQNKHTVNLCNITVMVDFDFKSVWTREGKIKVSDLTHKGYDRNIEEWVSFELQMLSLREYY